MAMSVNWGANGGLGMKHGRGPRWLWGGLRHLLGPCLASSAQWSWGQTPLQVPSAERTGFGGCSAKADEGDWPRVPPIS